MAALESSFYESQNQVYEYSKSRLLNTELIPVVEAESNVIKAIEFRDQDYLIDVISRFFGAFEAANTRSEIVRLQVITLLGHILAAFQPSKDLSKSLLSQDQFFSSAPWGYIELKDWMLSHLNQLSNSHIASTDENQRIARAIRYIQINHSKNIGLIDVAHDVGVSSEYLSRLFRSVVGINFKQFLTDIRMRKAMELLRGTGKLIGEIAKDCGFVSNRTFQDSFKHVIGQSPTQYRASK